MNILFYCTTILLFSFYNCYDFTVDLPLPDRRCFSMPGPDLPNIEIRPNAPFQIAANGNRQAMISNRCVDLARHHVIPYRTLRDFFNIAMERERHNPTRTMEDGREIFPFGLFLRNLVNDALTTANLNVYNLMNNIGTIRQYLRESVVVGNRLASGDFLTAVQNQNEFYIIQTFFIWMPSNIVIGPQHRDDDPGQNFDEELIPIINRNNNYRLFNTINNHMINYINDTTYFDYLDNGLVGSPTTLIRILMLLSRLIESQPHYYEFDPNDWIYAHTFYGRTGQIDEYNVVNNNRHPGPGRKKRYEKNDCFNVENTIYDIADITQHVIKPKINSKTEATYKIKYM